MLKCDRCGPVNHLDVKVDGSKKHLCTSGAVHGPGCNSVHYLDANTGEFRCEKGGNITADSVIADTRALLTQCLNCPKLSEPSTVLVTIPGLTNPEAALAKKKY